MQNQYSGLLQLSYAAFISFSFEDQKRAVEVQKLLSDAFLPTWFAFTHTQPGDVLSAVVLDGIVKSHCVVVLWSKQASQSRWVEQEIDYAYKEGRRIIYFCLDENVPDLDIHYIPHDHPDAESLLIKAVRESYSGRTPVVCMLNMKGGVGKTILSVNLFGCMAEKYRKRVLLVDMDPQHNLTQYLLPDSHLERHWLDDRNIVSAFEPSKLNGWPSPGADLTNIRSGKASEPREVSVSLIPKTSENDLRLVVGNFDVCKYTLPMGADPADQLRDNFRQFIQRAQDEFDVVVLDINPGASLLTKIALEMSGLILSPVRADTFSLKGLELLDDLLTEAYRINPSPLRLCVMNAVPGYEPVGALEQQLRETRDTLETRIPYSEYLKARGGDVLDSVIEGQYTRDMAYNIGAHQARNVQAALQSATEELMRRLGVPYDEIGQMEHSAAAE